eukprot:gene3849-4106_t
MSFESLLPFDCQDEVHSAEQRGVAAGDSEEEDLYADLDDADDEARTEAGTVVSRLQQQQIQELQQALAAKDTTIKQLTDQLGQTDKQVKQLSAERLVLLTNISSLFKTAQAEIKRHSTELQNARLELCKLQKPPTLRREVMAMINTTGGKLTATVIQSSALMSQGVLIFISSSSSS